MTSEENAFLAAIRTAPDDNLPRLVYADWLDEQNKPGGAFLRRECEAVKIDSTTDEWWVAMHELREAGQDLEEEWIAAVSRIPLGQIFARVREIQSWLHRRLAVAELPSGALKWDIPPPSATPQTPTRKSLWQRIRGFFSRAPEPTTVSSFGPDPSWAEAHMRPGDELWQYDTGGDSWAHLGGEMGYAIVRNGKVVEFEMVLMN